jgi:hypothetical protein
MFGCKIGLLRMLYLGMPELFETVGMWIWSLLMQGLLKKLDACQGNAVVVDWLVDSSLSSLISYVMYMTLLNKTFIEKVDKHRRR